MWRSHPISEQAMPATTSIINSMLQPSHYRAYGHLGNPMFSRFGILICSVTVLLILCLFSRRTARSWLTAHSARPPHLTISSRNITWTPKSSARWPSSRYPTNILGSLVRPRQGQGLFEKRAKDARISIEKVVRTALVGLGGAGEGSGRMMGRLPEEEGTASSTPATTSRSRGVSASASDANFAPSSYLPLSFNGSPPLPPAADQHSRGHVGIPRSPSPSSFTLAWGSSGGEDTEFFVAKGKSMEVDNRFGSLSRDLIDAASETEAYMPTTNCSPFGYHMTDDEHVSYDMGEYYSSGSQGSGVTATYRHTDLNFNRPPPPPPLVPPTMASQSLYSLYGTHQAEDQYGVSSQETSYYAPSGSTRTNTTMTRRPVDQGSDHEFVHAATSSKTRAPGRGNKSASTSRTLNKSVGTPRRKTHTKSIPIPSSANAEDGHKRRREHEDIQEFNDNSATITLAPSSFPSTSPLLPPPPPNYDYPFDPAEVMFPGGTVIDGGIRMVPTYEEDDDDDHSPRDGGMGQQHDEEYRHHSHESSSVDVGGEMMSVVDGSGGGWKRHTRVYGGGVCLACATAGGGQGGGYYGARVRPEDRRR